MNEQWHLHLWLSALAIGMAARMGGGDYGDDIDTDIGEGVRNAAAGKGVRQRIGHELSQEIYLDRNRERQVEIMAYDIERMRDELHSLRNLLNGVVITIIVGALIVIMTTLISVRSYDNLLRQTDRNTELIRDLNNRNIIP